MMLGYYPNAKDHPYFKISGHPTGKAWVFKDDGEFFGFGNTTDDSEFNSRVNDMRNKG